MSTPALPDTLYLWYLGTPEAPVLVGELNLVMNRRAVSLRYADTWLKNGFALSEDLPLGDQEFFPKDKDVAAGAVDDARPDRWGERVIRLLDRPPRLSLLEYLYYAGDDRFGALGVSSSAQTYLPREIGPLPKVGDVETLAEIVRRVLAREPIDERHKRLIAPGVTMGGARPKALLQLDGDEWVLKFAEADRPAEPLIEHASLTLAAKAGIAVVETRPIPFARGVALAIKRFDRWEGRRWHALSANVALKAAGVELSYPNLAQLLRRRGDVDTHRAQMHELFRRMVFNILIDNTDDHEKNHALLVVDLLRNGRLKLAPAYDVLPSNSGQGFQEFICGSHGRDSTLDNAMSQCDAFGLLPTEAAAEIAAVIELVSTWQAHFAQVGVSARDIDSLAERIDGEHLLTQRTGFNPARFQGTSARKKRTSPFRRP